MSEKNRFLGFQSGEAKGEAQLEQNEPPAVFSHGIEKVPVPASASNSGSNTTIAEDVTIIGEFHTDGNLDIQGSIKGNVSVNGDVNMSGKVVGNVVGANLYFTGSSVKGDVQSAGSLTMDEHALILGNVTADTAVLEGKIHGDIHVSGDTTLKPSVVVAGNIYSGTINMATGARVQGELHISSVEPASNAFQSSDFDITV